MQPFAVPLFRTAIFISSIYCYSASPTLGVDATESVPANERLAPPNSGTLSEMDLANYAVRRLTPGSVKAKILIPTAHVYGENDPLLNESLDLVKMCEGSFASTIMHSGAHDIPMDEETSKKIKEVIEIAIGKSQMLS